MFLALWHYLWGYVIVEVSGFSVERFVNLAAHRGIYLWNVHSQKGHVYFSVSHRGYPLLQECGQKTGCQYDIVREYGLPVFWKRFRKRQLLTFGVFFFVVGLYLLSSFVWVVEVEGNERITTEDILATCADFGLAPAVFKFTLDIDQVRDGLMEQYPDMAWVSVKLKGTNASIKLVETIPQPIMIDKDTPMDIVAAKDCIIESIAVEGGTPMVLSGDVVEKGEVLISSLLPIAVADAVKGDELVRARGTVRGRLYYDLQEELPISYIEKIPCEEWKEDHSVILKDSSLNILRPNFLEGKFEVVDRKVTPVALGDYKLPVSFVYEKYQRYEEVAKTRTPEEAKAMLEEILRKKGQEMLAKDGEILDFQITFTQTGEKITARAVLTVIENIGQEVKHNETTGDEAKNESGTNPSIGNTSG